MADPVYKVVEVVGTSNESISKAIGRAVSKAGATLRHLDWFEVVQIRGSIENDRIRQYQVSVKAGFTLEDDDAGLGAASMVRCASHVIANLPHRLVRKIRARGWRAETSMISRNALRQCKVVS